MVTRNCSFNGQLHAALATLEKWLCDLLVQGVDIEPYLTTLIHGTRSMAVVGDGKAPSRQILTPPSECRAVLRRAGTLTEDSALYLAQKLKTIPLDENVDLDGDFKTAACAAAAAALLVRAPQWLSAHPDDEQRARGIIRSALDRAHDTFELHRSIYGRPELEFAAYVAVRDWLVDPSPGTGRDSYAHRHQWRRQGDSHSFLSCVRQP